MTDVVGRLFHEFAITLAIAILISAFVSLTLTPMLCARLLKHQPEAEQSRFSVYMGQLFDRAIHKYGEWLSWVLTRQRATLWVAFGTLALTALLYVFVPKGFFPIQDTGVIQAITEAPQSISFAAMSERQQDAGQGNPQGPGGGKPVLLHRRGWQQRHAERRPYADHVEAAG